MQNSADRRESALHGTYLMPFNEEEAQIGIEDAKEVEGIYVPPPGLGGKRRDKRERWVFR